MLAQPCQSCVMHESGSDRVSTTEVVRLAIQQSPESLRVLARRFGIDPKTVAKWKARSGVCDLPRGPKPGRHSRLTAEEQDIIVRFREHTLLPLDDCLYALQAHIPHLTRSGLHRCLQRHGISRLVDRQGEMAAADPVSPAPGELHIDLAQVHSRDGVHYLFNAIEQASKFAFVRMVTAGDDRDAAGFLTLLTRRSPFRIDRVVTHDAQPFVGDIAANAFGRVCAQLGIEHRRASTLHPWSRNRSARIRRMLADDITFASESYLATLVEGLVRTYNFQRRLKTLRGKTPYEFLCDSWARDPDRFLRNPHHELAGLESGPTWVDAAV